MTIEIKFNRRVVEDLTEIHFKQGNKEVASVWFDNYECQSGRIEIPIKLIKKLLKADNSFTT